MFKYANSRENISRVPGKLTSGPQRTAVVLMSASLLTLLILFCIPSQPAAASASIRIPPNTPGSRTLHIPAFLRAETQMFGLINQARADHGLPAYTIDGKLYDAASAHSDVLLTNDAAGHPCANVHQCPGEPDTCTRIKNAGGAFPACSENAGTWWTTAAQPDYSQGIQKIFNCWMSEGHIPGKRTHYDNILDPNLTNLAVSVSLGSSSDHTRNILWEVEDYGGPAVDHVGQPITCQQ